MRDLISPDGSTNNLLSYLKKNNPYTKESSETLERLNTQSNASLKTDYKYGRNL